MSMRDILEALMNRRFPKWVRKTASAILFFTMARKRNR